MIAEKVLKPKCKNKTKVCDKPKSWRFKTAINHKQTVPTLHNQYFRRNQDSTINQLYSFLYL